MNTNKPKHPPVGATHLALEFTGQWVWLFEEPSDMTQYVEVESISN